MYLGIIYIYRKLCVISQLRLLALLTAQITLHYYLGYLIAYVVANVIIQFLKYHI